MAVESNDGHGAKGFIQVGGIFLQVFDILLQQDPEGFRNVRKGQRSLLQLQRINQLGCFRLYGRQGVDIMLQFSGCCAKTVCAFMQFVNVVQSALDILPFFNQFFDFKILRLSAIACPV